MRVKRTRGARETGCPPRFQSECEAAGEGSGVPEALRDVIIERIQQVGGGSVTEVRETTPGPGLNNRHFRYTATGGTFMAKVSTEKGTDKFEAEVAGLRAIRATGCVRAPEPFGLGKLPMGTGSFLLLEHLPCIPFGQSIPSVLQGLAEGLAAMHLAPLPEGATEGFGFPRDTFLGPYQQDNSWEGDFATFFASRRLAPQLRLAAKKFDTRYGTSNQDAMAFVSLGKKVMARAVEVLEPVRDSKPCLLHGDLWVGNCGAVPAEGRERQPVVFDPACWWGHHEFDLALATMFGGFGPPFYEVYHDMIPKADGFDQRMRLYKLYHYLNHLNLHGAGFGYGGTVEQPQGYYERTVTLMQDVAA